MAVYVDDAVTLWRDHRWAHLMADTLDELHAFAAALGIPRRAFQDKTSGAHYDVTAELRERAIALGAVPISRHRDRDRMRAVIANARRQGRRNAVGDDNGGDEFPQEPRMTAFDLSPPDDAQRRRLTEALDDDARRVLLAHGTEAPFCGAFLDDKRDGTYTCGFCGLPLFRSSAKFDSGTGWPSFFEPFDPAHIRYVRDLSHGMVRVEEVCARCGSHLGHVFPDGPPPTGERHCLNSVSLDFVAAGDPLPDPLGRGGPEAAAVK